MIQTARNIYERAKDVDIFRSMHRDFFYMFEMEKQKDIEGRSYDER